MLHQIKKKIALKLASLIVIVVTLVSSIAILYFNDINKDNLTEYLHISLSNAINFSELVYAQPLWDFNYQEVERLNRIVLRNKLIVAVNVYDADFLGGTMKKETKANHDMSWRSWLPKPWKKHDAKSDQPGDNTDSPEPAMVPESDLEKLNQPYVIPSNAPYIKKISGDIFLGGKNIGRFELFYTEEFINNAITMANKHMVFAFIIIGGFIISAVTITVTRINRPIVLLAELSERIARENNYDINITKSNRIDEVGMLVNGFANMMHQIRHKEKERNTLYDDLQQSLTRFHSLFSKLQHAIDHADYSLRLSPETDSDELAMSLNKVMSALENADTVKQNQNWLKNGQAELGALIGREQNIAVICRKAIEFIAAYVGAKVGTFFAKDETINDFKMMSSYAFKTRKGLTNRFKPGEGLAGQAALEKQPIIFTEVPDNYIRIESSLGHTVPRNIIVLPVIYEEDVKGVMELGTTVPLSDIQIEFLETVTEIVAVAINGAMFNEKLAILLEQTREQAEELKAQQEELRTTNEELEEQTMILKESEERLQDQQEELQTSNEELEEKTEILLIQKKEIQKSNEALKLKQKEIEEKAKQIELETKYKSEFLANMSHELRTPLNSLLILANMLSENEENNLTEDQVESADSIYRSGQNLLHLINDILDLSKIEAKKIELNISTFPLRDLGKNFNTEFQHMAKKKGIELSVSFDKNLPEMITSDMHRLEQIIRNLMGNAIKFTDQGEVQLFISRPDDNVTFNRLNSTLEKQAAIAIAVKDTGSGIPQDKLSSIFEAFKQVDGSIRRKHDGTGLGLSISKELAQLLGGEIQVSSELGQGSIFTIYVPEHLSSAPFEKEESDADHGSYDNRLKGLEKQNLSQLPPFSGFSPPSSANQEENPTPDCISQLDHPLQSENSPHTELDDASESAAEQIKTTVAPSGLSHIRGETALKQSSSSKEPHPTDQTKTMLIIEDDPDFADILSKFFNKNGYHTIIAPTGEKGIKYVIENSPTAIILDIMLPGIDGWAVMNELKTNPETRHIPVHIMSGYDHSRKGMEKGAVGYLTKPVSSEDLDMALNKIETVLSNDMKDLLVVEDNRELQLTILKLMGTSDIRVTAAVTGNEAISLLRKQHFDCMILDLGLPDISGFEILDTISQDSSIEMIPVIVFTGRDLTSQETAKLEQYSSSIVLKNAVSMERLIDETALFLHRVESEMPENQKKMIKKLRDQKSFLSEKRVMVVDDDMRNAFALNKYLKSKGMDVTIANNGAKALKTLQEEEPPDIILMDIMMPVMDGYETIRRIRRKKEFAKLPIIALTAKAMASDREECIRCGANDYISKPLDTSKLLTLLRVWLYN